MSALPQQHNSSWALNALLVSLDGEAVAEEVVEMNQRVLEVAVKSNFAVLLFGPWATGPDN
jgi:hypothetical protein